MQEYRAHTGEYRLGTDVCTPRVHAREELPRATARSHA